MLTMETIVILLAGFLFTCGFFLMLARNFIRMLIGVLFLSQAANLVILTLAGFGSGISPIIPGGKSLPLEGHPDPLPQALILTAIVIGFGIIAFAIVLFKTAYEDLKTDDLDSLKETDS